MDRLRHGDAARPNIPIIASRGIGSPNDCKRRVARGSGIRGRVTVKRHYPAAGRRPERDTLLRAPEGDVPPVAERTSARPPSHDVIARLVPDAAGIPLLAGRDFNEHETCSIIQNVVVISQSGAKKVFGNENPIGKTLARHQRRHAVSRSWASSATFARVRSNQSRRHGILSSAGRRRISHSQHRSAQHVARPDAVTKSVQIGAERRLIPGLAIAMPQIDGRQSWHRHSARRG